MDRRRLLVVSLGAIVLVLARLGAHGLWDPVETGVAEHTRWVFGAGPWGVRLPHAIGGICGIVAVWWAAHGRSPRAALFAAVALAASPAVLLGARSAAGGVFALAPVALALGGVDRFVTRGCRAGLGIAALGAGVAGYAIGIIAVGSAVALLATRSRRAVIAACVVAAATVIGWLIAGGHLPPAVEAANRSFDHGFGAVALGLFPMVAALPIARAREARPSVLAHLVVWLVFAALWPHEPLIMIAAAAPLAVLAGDAFDDLVTRTDPAPVLAVVSATIVLLVARSYDLEPARLVAAHLGGTIASSPGELPPATLLGLVAVAAALGAAPIVGERYRLACVSLALAASGAVTLLAAHHGSAQVSRTGSLAAFDGIEAGLGISGHFTSMRELSDVAALDAYLAEGTCPTAVVVNESLPALERRARGRFFVLGDGVAGFRRVSACLPAGAQDANPLRGKLLARLPADARSIAEWGNAIRLVAAEFPRTLDLTHDTVGVTLTFQAVAPVPEGYRVALRLECPNALLFGDHELVDGELTTEALAAGDVIVDHAEIDIDEVQPSTCTLSVGWRRPRRLELMPITSHERPADETERVSVGEIVLSAAGAP